MNKKVVVVFDIQADDEFHKTKQINEFLSRCFRDFAATYSIIDYEIIGNTNDNKKQTTN